MAKKQRNINIIYKVDTKEVQAAKVQVEQADKITNKLIDSTKKYETTSSAAYKRTSVSIQDMNVKLDVLRKQIETTDVKDSARLDKLLQKYRVLSADVQKYNALLNQSTQASQSFTSQITGLYNLVRGGILVGLIKETSQALTNMAILQGKVDGVKRAFDRIPQSTKIMADLRVATKGVLTDYELMQRALQARNFKIPLEEFATLLEFATTRAQQTGQSVDYLVDSIVRGIGMQSILRLDNLGISASRLREEFKGVSIRSLEISEVTKGVANVVKEEMKDMGSYVKTSETQVLSLQRAWKELYQTITGGPGSLWGDVAEFFSKGLDNLNDFIKGNAKVNIELAKTSGQNKAAAFLNEKINKDNLEAIDAQIIALEQLGAKQKINILLKRDELKQAEELGIKGVDQAALLREQIETFTLRNFETNAYIKALKEERKSIVLRNKEEETSIQTLQDLEDQLSALNQQFEEETDRNDQAALRNIGQKILKTQALIDKVNALREAEKTVETEDSIDIEAFKKSADQTIKNQEDFDKAMIDLDKKTQEDIDKMYEDWYKDQLDKQKEYLDERIRQDREAKAREKALQREVQDFVINSSRDILLAAALGREQDYEHQVRYYEDLLEVAGDNDKAREELEKKRDQAAEEARRKQAEAEKRATLIRIAVDTAANIVRSILQNGGVPAGIPFGLIAAGIGATQAAVVSRLSYSSNRRGASGFKDGVIDLDGPGNEKSDSIPAWLSRHESVMTAEETKNSGKILRAIRAKKLNDEIFERLHIEGKVPGVDMKPIEGVLGKIQPPDLVKQGDFIYEMKTEGKNLKRKIRSKSFKM